MFLFGIVATNMFNYYYSPLHATDSKRNKVGAMGARVRGVRGDTVEGIADELSTEAALDPIRDGFCGSGDQLCSGCTVRCDYRLRHALKSFRSQLCALRTSTEAIDRNGEMLMKSLVGHSTTPGYEHTASWGDRPGRGPVRSVGHDRGDRAGSISRPCRKGNSDELSTD